MESVKINVSPERLRIFNGKNLGIDLLICTLPALIFPKIALFMFGLFVYNIVFHHVFNRGMRVITEVSADEEKIVLTYYKWWVKRSIEISKKTFGKIIVERNAKSLCIFIFDKRFLAPPAMRIGYTTRELDRTCDSKEDVEAVIKLLEKYYHIEYVSRIII